MSCAPFKTKQLFFLFQFYILVVQIEILILAVGGIHILVSTNRESEWKLAKFHYCPSTSQPVNHSIFFLELKHLMKFHCRHQQCHHIGHFNPYHIMYTLCFTGYYILCRRQCLCLWFGCFSRWEGQFLKFIGCQILDNQFRSSDQIDQHLSFLWWGSCPHLCY